MVIQGFEAVPYLEAFRLEKAAGTHSRCVFRFATGEGQAAQVLGRVGKTLCVTTDAGMPAFYGRIERVSRIETQESFRLEVAAVALSITEDEQSHDRVFQDEKKTMKDVLAAGKLGMKKSTVTLDRTIGGAAYRPLLVQYRETNMHFLCRIAKALGTHVWIKDTFPDRAAFLIGPRAAESRATLHYEQLRSYAVHHVQLRRTAEICVEQYLELGTRVRLGDETMTYVITHAIVEKTEETFYGTYVLEEDTAGKPPKLHIPVESALTLRAAVTAVSTKGGEPVQQHGCVKLNFLDGVEDVGSARVPYRTPYAGKAGGLVFLPELGDIVEVTFAGEQAFVVSEFRTHPLQKEYGQPADKYIGNNFDQRILWKKDALELRSKTSSIILKEKSIALTTGKAKITLDEKGIYLQYADHAITLSDAGVAAKTPAAIGLEAAKNVTAKAGGALQMEAAQNATVNAYGNAAVKSGGAIRLDSSGETSVKASSIHLG